MTAEEFTAKLEEMRAVLADKAAELEEHPKWGTSDQREEILTALHEIGVQVEALEEVLQEEVEEVEDASEEAWPAPACSSGN
jgi:hypothetical protein